MLQDPAVGWLRAMRPSQYVLIDPVPSTHRCAQPPFAGFELSKKDPANASVRSRSPSVQEEALTSPPSNAPTRKERVESGDVHGSLIRFPSGVFESATPNTTNENAVTPAYQKRAFTGHPTSRHRHAGVGIPF